MLTSALTTVGAVWLASGCRPLGNASLMRYGFADIRVRGPGINRSCRTEARYQYSGFFNPTRTGWSVGFGPEMAFPEVNGSPDDDPVGWCKVYLTTQHPLRSGSTLRTDAPHGSADAVRAVALAVRSPYNASANPGIVWVDEATRSRVRGRFQMTLNRWANEAPGEPITMEGVFEIHRDPPAER